MILLCIISALCHELLSISLNPQKILLFLNFILFNFTILYWFCHISKWICHRYTYVPHPEPSSLLPPPSPYHPSGLSQCTSPKHPVSCIEPGLAARFIYDIMHISMPFSQIIPPSPSPTDSKRMFYTSVSLLLSHTQGYCYHLSEWSKPERKTPVQYTNAYICLCFLFIYYKWFLL